MRFSPVLILFLASFFGLSEIQAQQSSKSKAANKLYEKGNEIKILNAELVNSSDLEFSPSFYQNGIVFASSRNKDAAKDEAIDEAFFELFYSDLNDEGTPTGADLFSLKLNTRFHEGPVSFNRKGTEMYFTSNNNKNGVRKADKSGVTRMKIYRAEKGAQDWKNIKELSFNSSEYSCMHPSLSADGQQLYFSSDMPGGFGGFDLYVVNLKPNGTWGAPQNLGDKVNTQGSDAFPFIHSSGNLFFTSSGYEGAGGLDLFMMNTKTKGPVTNLGEPFNSEGDDLGLIVSPDGKSGYFSSSRTGGVGKDDIYMFTATQGIWGRTRPSSFLANIDVYDEDQKTKVEGASIRVFERTNDGLIGGTNRDLYETVLLPVDEQKNELTFRLVRREEGGLGDPDAISDKKGNAQYLFYGERQYVILVTKPGYRSVERAYSTIGNTGADKFAIGIKKMDCQTHKGKIIAGGKAVGDAVVRIKNLTRGTEDVLLASPEGTFEYCLPEGCEYELVAVKEQYNGMPQQFSTKANTSPQQLVLALTSPTAKKGLPAYKEGAVLVLENLYYDFDKSYIQAGSMRELENLADILLQNPGMTIELGAHTDARGASDYNQQLSEKRAQSARKFLLSKGVKATQVKAVGYGEAAIRNHCQSGIACSDEEHKYNRRTEVKILKR